MLGRQQAELTGARLRELGIEWDKMERSTMTRAQETAKLIAKFLNPTLPFRDCNLLEEGAPVPPEPPVGHWRPEPHVRKCPISIYIYLLNSSTQFHYESNENCNPISFYLIHHIE